MASAPSVLLLDEPAAGLGSGEVQELIVLLRRLAREWGMAIILVEHHMEMVMTVCDRDPGDEPGPHPGGRHSGGSQRDEAVRAAYLGSREPEAPEQDETIPGTVPQ